MQINEMVLVIVLAIAVVTDVRTHKIKNWLTLPAIAIGPVINLIQGGMDQMLLSIAGMGVMILVAAALVVPRLFGGGDAKLLVAVGSLAGMSVIRDTLLFSALAGGVLAIAVLIRHRAAGAVLGRLARVLWLKIGLHVNPQGVVTSGIKLPYSVAIAAGTITAVVIATMGRHV